MAFNQGVKKLVVRDKRTGEHLPCVMCGKTYPLPDAVHIIDEKEWVRKLGNDSKINGMPLCPNCHRVFDEVLRPYLYHALRKFGCQGVPESWARNNKHSVVSEKDFGIGVPESSAS